MIVVNAVLESSEADIDALKDAITRMETKSRAEGGCLDYTFSVEVNRPDVVRITEKWESLAALRSHFEQPHMQEFREAMAQYPSTRAKASFYEVKELDPFA